MVELMIVVAVIAILVALNILREAAHLMWRSVEGLMDAAIRDGHAEFPEALADRGERGGAGGEGEVHTGISDLNGGNVQKPE